MDIGKVEILTALDPILAPAPTWFLTAAKKHDDEIKVEDRADLGPLHRAVYLRCIALALMSRDSVVVGNFRPREDKQLCGLTFEGEEDSPSITVLFNKATKDKFGRLRTSSRSERQQDRRAGNLWMGETRCIPVVLFYELDPLSTDLEPRISRIGIGVEGRRGFKWIETLWTANEGFSKGIGETQPTLPQMPTTKVRLRKPDQKQNPSRVGIAAEARANEEKQAGMTKNKGDGTKGA